MDRYKKTTYLSHCCIHSGTRHRLFNYMRLSVPLHLDWPTNLQIQTFKITIH